VEVLVRSSSCASSLRSLGCAWGSWWPRLSRYAVGHLVRHVVAGISLDRFSGAWYCLLGLRGMTRSISIETMV